MKTKNQLVIAASVAALTVYAPLTSWAKEKKTTSAEPIDPTAQSSPTTNPPAVKSQRAVPYHGKVAEVDQNARTFTIAGKEHMRVFKITEVTVITKDGNPATITDIVADEDVRGSYWKRSDGSLETKTVKLGQKTDAESKSKRKKKEKAESDTTPEPSGKR